MEKTTRLLVVKLVSLSI